jgi:pyrimidine deaminase RibD-like protein
MYEKLFEISRKSPHNFKHVAIVERAGKILAIGYNHDGIHAEESALKKLWPSERIGTRVVSLRFTKTGKLAASLAVVSKLLLESGVKKVTYSTPEGDLKAYRTNQLPLELI